jgi:MATE family multidrug resistance protein
MYIAMVTAVIHFGWCHLLVNVAMLDIMGTSYATIITYFTNFLVVTIYCNRREDLKPSFFFPDIDTFKDLKQYVAIGLPSAFMFCLECWSYEILALISAYISVLAVGTMAILINTFTVLQMVPYGFQIVATVFVGNVILSPIY